MPAARPRDRCNPCTANTKRQRMTPMKIVAPMKTNEASSQQTFTPEMVFHKPAGPIVQLSRTCSANDNAPQSSPSCSSASPAKMTCKIHATKTEQTNSLSVRRRALDVEFNPLPRWISGGRRPPSRRRLEAWAELEHLDVFRLHEVLEPLKINHTLARRAVVAGRELHVVQMKTAQAPGPSTPSAVGGG